jgi:hypothetical protein
MPYSWKVDPALRLVSVRGWGPMDLEESLSAPHRVLSDPEVEPDFGILVDLRELDYEPRPEDLIAVARNLIDIGPRLRNVAIVVTEALATAAEVGSAMAAAGGISQRVFTDPEEARRWLLEVSRGSG